MKQNTFGPTQSWIYSIGWQKKDLPNGHVCVCVRARARHVYALDSFTAWLFMARALWSLQCLMIHVWTCSRPLLQSNWTHQHKRCKCICTVF